MRRTSPLIVGGGPAAAATAIGLPQSGLRPVILERQRVVGDAICGGFLSWATIARLERLGISTAAIGAHPVRDLRVLTAQQSAQVRLPECGAGLSRHALDQALLARAEALGAGIERGVHARSIDETSVELADGSTLAADHIVLATGKHDVRSHMRARHPGKPTHGIRWRLKATPRLRELLDGRIELHLFRGGYAGLVLQEDGTANLCLAVSGGRWDEEGRNPAGLLEALARELPELEHRIGIAAAIGNPDAIANVPYGWRAGPEAGGLYRVGDQAGVIPSIAGEGIDIALASGSAAATAIVRRDGPVAFHKSLLQTLQRPMRVAGGIWRMAERPAGAAALVSAMRLAPPAANLIARLTRV
jgi:menaquinone-9 beta-reductase